MTPGNSSQCSQARRTADRLVKHVGTTSQRLSARDLEQAAARWPLTRRLSLCARNLKQLGMVVKRLSAGTFPNLKDLELHLVRVRVCVCVGGPSPTPIYCR